LEPHEQFDDLDTPAVRIVMDDDDKPPEKAEP
jgi:cbb3-type cytochrome oxidase maturation protein